jgi:hypothetical protein
MTGGLGESARCAGGQRKQCDRRGQDDHAADVHDPPSESSGSDTRQIVMTAAEDGQDWMMPVASVRKGPGQACGKPGQAPCSDMSSVGWGGHLALFSITLNRMGCLTG